MRHSLVELAESGFWFCSTCQRITDPRENWQGMHSCQHCGSLKISWNAPITDHPKKHLNDEKQKNPFHS